MYTSTEDARSDLFLSGAVYVFGPLVIQLVRGIVPLDRIPGVTPVLALVVPVATTALVPWLLMRYRHETWSQYGYGTGLRPNFGIGLLLAAPIVLAVPIAFLLSGDNPLSGLFVFGVLGGQILVFVAHVLTWLGLGFLAVYATVKARDAFRSDYRTVRDETIRLGQILAAVAAVTVSLVLISSLPARGDLLGSRLDVWPILLLPVGVAGGMVLLLRTLSGPSATSRATMLTPVVLLALGPFQLSLQGAVFAISAWQATLYAGIGLMIAALQESRRSALASLGLTLALGVLTPL